MTTPPLQWENAALALTLLAIDPEGLGGIWLRARSGPVRDRFFTGIGSNLPQKRLHPAVTDDQLFGGLDLAATLDLGRSVVTDGLLTGPPSMLMVTMAERCPTSLAAKIALTLDKGNGHCAILLDEGTEEERAPEALTDRVAFHVDLSDLSHRDCPNITLGSARTALTKIRVPAKLIEDTVLLAMRLGIDSLRAANFAIRAARAIAALHGETAVTEAHLAQAVALVFAPRATIIPDIDEVPQDEPAPPPEEQNQSEAEPKNSKQELPSELLLEAIAANLPADMLDKIAAAKAGKVTQGSGSGAAKKGNRRGRPKPSARGRLGSGARIDLVATLRAAAPWQTMRRQAPHAPDRVLHVRASDIRLKQFEEKSDRLLIFAVDASGSAALARLAEAKGAVELLLAEAYARRDHVALIAFRGTDAEILLPPTRSLVQTKKRLSALPGGGGTPLAAGMEAALQMAEQTRSKGLTPTIAILTDGRSNIALDGSADRKAAGEDAMQMARLIRARGTPSLVIDTGNRPAKALEELARELAAPYLPLPRADAHRVSKAIDTVLE